MEEEERGSDMYGWMDDYETLIGEKKKKKISIYDNEISVRAFRLIQRSSKTFVA